MKTTQFAQSLPKISIITITYNASEHLPKTIASIAALTYPNLEYIIIDGGSTDSTLQIIQDNISLISQYISEPDQGLYDAMNKGIKLSTGDYLWFINAGDKPARCNILETIFNDQSRLDYYYGDTNLIDANENKLKTLIAPNNLDWKKMSFGMKVSHQSFIASRQVSPKYDLSHKYIADQKWIIDILRNSKEGKYINTPLSNYLVGGLSDKRFIHFVFDKISYSFHEFSPYRASLVITLDILKALKFYLLKFIRR